MTNQDLINLLIGFVGCVAGYVIRMLWAEIKTLQSADKELVKDLETMKILVAGQYVKKDEFERVAAAMFAKLDKIYDRLSGRLDKHDSEQ